MINEKLMNEYEKIQYLKLRKNFHNWGDKLSFARDNYWSKDKITVLRNKAKAAAKSFADFQDKITLKNLKCSFCNEILDRSIHEVRNVPEIKNNPICNNCFIPR